MMIGDDYNRLLPATSCLFAQVKCTTSRVRKKVSFWFLDFDDQEVISMMDNDCRRLGSLWSESWRYFQFLTNELRLSTEAIAKGRPFLFAAMGLILQSLKLMNDRPAIPTKRLSRTEWNICFRGIRLT